MLVGAESGAHLEFAHAARRYPDSGDLFTLDWLRTLATNGLPEFSAFYRTGSAPCAKGVEFSPACIEELLPAFDLLHGQRDLARLCLAGQHLRRSCPRHEGGHIGGLPGAHETDQRLDAALDFLHANYLQPVSLEAVAHAASASPSTIKRLFRAHLGASMIDLLVQLRKGHACHLLVTTEKPVGFIAGERHHQPGHFSLFRQRHRMTPAEFAVVITCGRAAIWPEVGDGAYYSPTSHPAPVSRRARHPRLSPE